MSTTTISTRITNPVTLGSSQYSANLTITNTGSVQTSTGVDAIYGSASLANFTLTNQGFISNANNGVFANGPGTLINSGTFSGGNTAFNDGGNAYVENSGLLSGAIDALELTGTTGSNVVNNQLTGTITGQTGVFAVFATVINNGIIQGSGFGIKLLAGGTIIEAGTVSGNTDAIITGPNAFTLDVEAGAVFVGHVSDQGNSGRLNLAGSTAGSLNLGGTFTGFSQISFGSAAWTLEGTSAELTTNGSITGSPVVTITGFAVGDQLELSDFTATSGSYVAGTGLVLSNATASETIALIAPSENFYLNNGTITALISTISTPVTNSVTLGNGTYATNLTITNTGTVNSGSANFAVYVPSSLNNFTLTNQGTINNPSGIAIYTNGLGTILNSGIINGQDGIIAQGALIATNSSGGVISGTYDGVYLRSSGTILNSGSISGNDVGISADGTLIATNNRGGVISAAVEGVILHASGTILNSGSISGQYGITAQGTLIATNNSGGIISGTDDGVFLDSGGTIFNSGSISGPQFAIYSIGDAYVQNNGLIASNFTGVYLKTGGTILNSGTISGQDFAIRSKGQAYVQNNGLIASNDTGVYLSAGGTILNSGTISGSNEDSIYVRGNAYVQNAGLISNEIALNGGTILNSGTISGVILNVSGAFTLGVEAGAVFNGDVSDNADTGVIALAGTTAGTLNIGTSFGGFSSITFGPADWTLEGDIADLDKTVAISGFTSADTLNLSGFSINGDEIILSDFSASSDTLVGTNLVLSNGSQTETITLTSPLATGGSFAVTANPTGTTINVEVPLISIISTGITNVVSLGNGIYASAVTVTNTGTVTTQEAIVDHVGAGTVVNDGTITGSSVGVLLYDGGSILNSGTISSPVGFGIVLETGGYVLNAGTISGHRDAIEAIGAFTLAVDSGAVFAGTVLDESDTGLLTLAGTTAGSLNLGGTFTGFSQISFGSAAWTLQGNSAELATGQTISGFTTGDRIDLENISASNSSFANGTLTLFNGGGTSLASLDFAALPTTGFLLSNDGAGGTDIALCYLRGTSILTPTGEKPIETLNIGDQVVTRFGGGTKIKWLGRQSYAPHFIANNQEKWPIHITKGALDGTLPHRDLFISPGHSMLIGDTLILAKNLINGLTIRQEKPEQNIDYIQIELETHDCIQAEGAWSETFADAPGLRAQFHNQAEFWALYPDYQTPETLALCAPRPERGPALEAALRPLLPAHTPGPLRGCIDQITTAGIEGWAQDTANPHLPILLEIRLSGRRYATILACDFRADLAESGIGTGHHAFTYRATLPELFLPHLTIHRASDGAQLDPAKHHQKAA